MEAVLQSSAAPPAAAAVCPAIATGVSTVPSWYGPGPAAGSPTALATLYTASACSTITAVSTIATGSPTAVVTLSTAFVCSTITSVATVVAGATVVAADPTQGAAESATSAAIWLPLGLATLRCQWLLRQPRCHW